MFGPEGWGAVEDHDCSILFSFVAPAGVLVGLSLFCFFLSYFCYASFRSITFFFSSHSSDIKFLLLCQLWFIVLFPLFGVIPLFFFPRVFNSVLCWISFTLVLKKRCIDHDDDDDCLLQQFSFHLSSHINTRVFSVQKCLGMKCRMRFWMSVFDFDSSSAWYFL